MPQITCLIRRIPTGKGKRVKLPPPDFDKISRQFPLPEQSVDKLPLPLPNKVEHSVPVAETNTGHVHDIHHKWAASKNHIKTLKQVNQPQSYGRTYTLASLVERAFANGYVPDYYVLVKSMPKEDHVAQQQLRHARLGMAQVHTDFGPKYLR